MLDSSNLNFNLIVVVRWQRRVAGTNGFRDRLDKGEIVAAESHNVIDKRKTVDCQVLIFTSRILIRFRRL